MASAAGQYDAAVRAGGDDVVFWLSAIRSKAGSLSLSLSLSLVPIALLLSLEKRMNPEG
jgi:hypothetical protein